MHGKYPKTFFSQTESRAITKAIADAEKNTSGEIRLHLQRALGEDALEEGKKIFEKIGMTRTRDRNGVLFLLGLKTRCFVILGDKGIDEKVPKHFWEDIRDLVIDHFKKDKFAEGLCAGIRLCGEKLKEFFPYQTDDTDELSNEISLGE